MASSDGMVGSVNATDRWHPLAAIKRDSIVNVGSLDPASIRETVDVGTPALAASALRESPARSRACRTSSLALTLVAYMQHLEATTPSVPDAGLVRDVGVGVPVRGESGRDGVELVV
jgi:hypothetical protein